jgi:hypothetical protein
VKLGVTTLFVVALAVFCVDFVGEGGLTQVLPIIFLINHYNNL